MCSGFNYKLYMLSASTTVMNNVNIYKLNCECEHQSCIYVAVEFIDRASQNQSISRIVFLNFHHAL